MFLFSGGCPSAYIKQSLFIHSTSGNGGKPVKKIPARCIQEYRNDLTYFTNGQGVCLTELKGYQPATGKLICQPRRPNSRIDKVRHMFHKLA